MPLIPPKLNNYVIHKLFLLGNSQQSNKNKSNKKIAGNGLMKEWKYLSDKYTIFQTNLNWDNENIPFFIWENVQWKQTISDPSKHNFRPK